MANLSKESIRKIVKFTSRVFLNKKCPLWLQRKGLNLLGGYAPLPKPITVETSVLADRPTWWFNHASIRAEQVVLYFHGGGYGTGSPRSHRDLCAHLAKYSQISVASLAFRLAPEHPYPAALDDATAAYQALLEQGYSNKQIVLAGDSAGGGLALSLAVRLKQLNLLQPAGLFLISPLVNFSRDAASHTTQYEVDPVINKGWAEQMTTNYLLNSEELKQQACMLDKDLSGLPPILLHVGTDEVLLDDSLSLKQLATKAGVHVRLVTFPEMWHVFHFSASLFKPARVALKQAGEFVFQLMK